MTQGDCQLKKPKPVLLANPVLNKQHPANVHSTYKFQLSGCGQVTRKGPRDLERVSQLLAVTKPLQQWPGGQRSADDPSCLSHCDAP